MNLASAASRRVGPVVLALALSLGLCVHAHAADNAALERRLDESLHLIEALNRRLEQVEKELAAARMPSIVAAATAPAASAPPAASTDTRLDEVERTVSQLTASSGRDLREPGLPLHGFADVGFVQMHNAPPGQHDGFAVGTLDFHLTPEFGANVKTLVELNFGVSATDTPMWISNGHRSATLSAMR